MFWKYSHQTHPQQLDHLLDNKDVTLKQLLDEEDVLQECRAQNKKLIEFLIKPEIMEELVTLIIVEPVVSSGDGDGTEAPDEFTMYKYANTACELLACDIPPLNERLAGDEVLMRKLYSFLEGAPPLNPLLASFFARTLGVLLTRNSPEQNWYSYQLTCLQVLEFLKSREDFVSLLLRHMGTSAIMDLMFKLFTSVEGDQMRLNLLNWLNEQQVVRRLVSLFDSSVDPERHSNVSHLLCNVIAKCRDSAAQAEAGPPTTNLILKVIESREMVTLILELMFADSGPNGEKSKSAICGGIPVLLEILDYNHNSQDNAIGGIGSGHLNRDGDNPASVKEHKLMVEEFVKAVVPFLPNLHALLLDPRPQKDTIEPIEEMLNYPLGATRLEVAKLICALIATHSPAIDSCLIKLKTIQLLLDLFRQYTWNNFLHTQVEHAIALALDPKSKTDEENAEVKPEENKDVERKEEDIHETSLVHHIFTSCNIIKWILDAWDLNKDEQSKPGGRRMGYMGHLIKIANNVAKLTVPPTEEETSETPAAPVAAVEITSDKEDTRSPLTATSPNSSPSPPTSPSPSTSPTDKNKPQFFNLIKPPVINDDLYKKWCAFVTSSLAQANARNNILLGGEHPSHASPASDEAVYGGVQIKQENELEENYNAYQNQQIAPMFTENFHDEGFTEEDDTILDAVDNVPSMSYNMTEDDLTRQAEIFMRLCAEKMHESSSCSSLDGSDQEEAEEDDEDEYDDEGGSFMKGGGHFIQQRLDLDSRDKPSGNGGNRKERGGSSDEEEDEDGDRRQRRKDIQMEVDSTDPWAAMDPSSNLGLAPVAMDEAPNPWGDSSNIIGASQMASIAPSGLLNSQDDTGWADFSSAAGLGAVGGFANFEANFGMPSEEEPKDRNKNMETMPSNEDLGENLGKDISQEDSNVIPTQSQRVPKPIGEGMTSEESEMLQPNQVGGSEGVTLGWEDVPATSFSVSDCNSTGPDDRMLLTGSDDNANPSLGGSNINFQEELSKNLTQRFIELMDRSSISQFTTAAGDPAEPNLANESTILPESSVPSLPTNPTSEDSQQTEAARKLGSLAAEASVLPQPSTESPANGPV